MPQMSPLNWVSLFISFTLIFLLINSTNYFFFMKSTEKKSKNIKLNQINWKW